MSASAPSAPPFTVAVSAEPGGGARLRLSGRVTLEDAPDVASALRQEAAKATGALIVDLSGLAAIDGGASAILLAEKASFAAAGREVRVEAGSGPVGALVQLVGGRAPQPSAKSAPATLGTFDQIGRTTLVLLEHGACLLDYVGRVSVAAWGAIRRPSSLPWRDVGPLLERAGADGLPIVALLSFLLGLILAVNGAIQLKPFGANIFVADMVALIVTRELGPLMVAIIVAGRSGAAFAAELGTMKVSEEVDALRTLGLDPYRHLVIPRILALLVAVPILTLVGDAIALVGGLVIGITTLDLTPRAYLLQTQLRLVPWDVFSGVLKSLAYGLAVGLVSCERGLATGGGAEGVGRATTSSVVTILFFLIVIDFLFTIAFQVLGL